MGTKNNPGRYDCYANAKPDEPMFILLGRDPMASLLVRLWAIARYFRDPEDLLQCKEAKRCADEMEAYAKSLGKDVVQVIPSFIKAITALQDFLDTGDVVSQFIAGFKESFFGKRRR